MKLPLRAAVRALPITVLFAAACSDRNPVGGLPEGPQPRTQRLECTALVRAGTLACVSAGPATGGARGDLLVGAEYVKLASSGVHYDSAAGLLHADVTVQNLMRQAIGTTDGTTADSGGVKVFFQSGPTLTQGSGSVSVANADGLGVFTASGQPFFRYTGVLGPLQTSAARHWQFALGSGVQAFTFTLFVSVPVASEDGLVDVTPAHPYLHTGTTRQLAATVRTGAGGVVQGAPVQWSSSNPSVATVDANGVVTALSPDTVTITATSGARTGATRLTVTAGEGDVTPATLTGVAFTPHQVDVTGGPAQVTVTLTGEDAETGVQSAGLVFRSPTQAHDLACSTAEPAGTPDHPTFQCIVTVPQGAEAGTWTVAFATLRDGVMNLTDVQRADLEAAGLWTVLQVASAPDSVAPALASLSFSPDSVDITSSVQNVAVSIGATDAGSGLASAGIVFRSPSQAHDVNCSTADMASGTPQAGTFQCTLPVPRGSETGDWQVAFITLRDRANNLRQVQPADLAAAGVPTVLRVRGTQDVDAPTVTSFAFTPDSVDVRAQARDVTVTLGAADAGTGMYDGSANVVFRSPSNNQTASCQTYTRVSGTDQAGTWQCQFTVPAGAEGGAWHVVFIVLRDQANNLRVVQGSELAAAGYPVTLTVTSN